MVEAAAVAMALAAMAGSWLALGVPWWVGAAGVALALWRRATVVLVVSILVLSSGLAHRARAGASPLAPGSIAGTLTLLDDPAEEFGAIVVTARYGSAHVEVWARSGAAGQLRSRLAGERVDVVGRIVAIEPSVQRRLALRHVRGRVVLERVAGWSAGDPASRAANRIRRTIDHGARVLPPTERSLLLGFVLGDDRAQPEEVRHAFRDAGLAHLSAVSGQNVSLLLAAASPLLGRLSLRRRWLATLVLLAWFALLTRFEPSVLRATAMASIAATSVYLARPASSLRLLSLAVTGLLLVDPLLVHSVGWWLSVSATAGIVVLSAPLAARLPGPRPLALAVAVTAAAQLGVAPVQLAVFGPLPLASLPANLLAVPVAGPVMVWGLATGLLAGLAPEPVAAALHLPSLLGVRWIAMVARLGQAAPLPSVGWPVVVAALTAVVAFALRAHRRAGPGPLRSLRASRAR